MDHQEQCRSAAAALRRLDDRAPAVLVGFDGFIDQIIDVVGKRHDPQRYDRIETIAAFGERVSRAAGKSTNFELVVRQTKIGGNGPIMANALLGYRHAVTYVGVVGDGQIHPVFQPLAEGAVAIHALGAPASTDALEFHDGKLMLGKLTPMEGVAYDRLVEVLGIERLRSLLRETDAVATVNWTMSLGMTEIWQRIAREILPGLRKDRPLWFVDFCDPAKRTIEDLCEALDALRALQEHVDVVLGMNGSEGQQVLSALGGTWQGSPEDNAAAVDCCAQVRRRLGIARTVVHLTRSAATAGAAGAVGADGFFTPRPKLTTGAGDHFNAGFLAALSRGLGDRDCLLCGGATSGFYVRSGRSPSRHDVAAFLEEWVAQSSASS